MTEQISLFDTTQSELLLGYDERAELLFGDADKGLLNKWKVFHAENPHVYRKFREYAIRIKNRGKDKYSAWTIVNVIRWESDLAETQGSPFLISNDFIALYARLLVYQHPEFEGFFDLKKMKSSRRHYSDEEIERSVERKRLCPSN